MYQLLEAKDDEEFLEIMALVGMATKPLHVRRLQKELLVSRGIQLLDYINTCRTTPIYSPRTPRFTVHDPIHCRSNMGINMAHGWAGRHQPYTHKSFWSKGGSVGVEAGCYHHGLYLKGEIYESIQNSFYFSTFVKKKSKISYMYIHWPYKKYCTAFFLSFFRSFFHSSCLLSF